MKFRIRAVIGVLMLTMTAACGQNGAPAPTVAPAPEATSQTASAAPPSDNVNAPPTVNGMYVVKNACSGEGCHFERMQAAKALDLYDAPSPN